MVSTCTADVKVLKVVSRLSFPIFTIYDNMKGPFLYLYNYDQQKLIHFNLFSKKLHVIPLSFASFLTT